MAPPISAPKIRVTAVSRSPRSNASDERGQDEREADVRRHADGEGLQVRRRVGDSDYEEDTGECEPSHLGHRL